MTPPTDKPRLSQVDPDVFAKDLVQKIVDDLHSRAFGLGPGIMMHLDRPVAVKATTLYHQARDLARWARDGVIEHVDDTHDLCLAIATACWPSPLYGGGAGPDLFGDADPETAPGLLIIAAFAREKIARGEPVSSRELAALASVAQAHVNLLASKGEIRRGKGDLFPAKEARRWLSARGVPGFSA